MRLIRFREAGAEKPGVVMEDQLFDVQGFGEDYDEKFFASGGLQRLQQFLERARLRPLEKNVELAPPFARPSKIICIGLNYADHARETGATLPSEPVVFLKSTTALCGPNDDIVIPKNSKKTD